MKTIDMIGGFVKDYIKPDIFEKYIYDHYVDVEKEIPADIFEKITETNFKNEADIVHIKKELSDYYGNQLDKYNDAYYEIEVEQDEKLRKTIGYDDFEQNIVFDCSDISTKEELLRKIKRVFDMPEWFGMNWDAFNDLFPVHEYKKIELNNFYKMSDMISADASIFLEILKKNSEQDCQIIINNN